MNELYKTKCDKDCRAISPDFFAKLVKGGILHPFVDLVKNHSELVLCFRGNSYPEEVCIYRNNHAMFTFTSDKLYINPNHLRYCPDWVDKLRLLVDVENGYGFNNGTMPKLKPVKKSVQHYRNGNERVLYSTEFEDNYNFFRTMDEHLLDKLNDLYELLTEVFNVSFDYNPKHRDTTGIDRFLEWGNQYDANYKGEIPITYTYNKNNKIEKIRQQQLFSAVKQQKDGYFFYDLEFTQKEDSASNKPDMQAIRFDQNGKPVALALVEVKSKDSAWEGKSGLIKHINGMRTYRKEKYRLDARRREAFLIMHQYNELGLIHNLQREIIEEEYKNLPLENIFIFTDDAINKWETDSREEVRNLREKQNKSIGQIIPISGEIVGILVKDYQS